MSPTGSEGVLELGRVQREVKSDIPAHREVVDDVMSFACWDAD